MKQLGLTINITKGERFAVCNAGISFGSIREGSMIRFEGDSHLYTIVGTKEDIILEEFKVNRPDQIVIDFDTKNYFMRGDQIDLSYKESELLSVFKIENPGKKYKVNDQIWLSGGTPVQNTETGLIQKTGFTVDDVDKEGRIKKFSILSNGVYTQEPDEENYIEGGSGSGAIFSVKFKEIKQRKTLQTTILKAANTDTRTLIHLNKPLPEGLQRGDLSMRKWQLLIKEPYAGETKINCSYEISRDYTPFLKIPLVANGTINPQILYSHAVKIIDQKLAEIEERIKKLEKT